MAKSRIALVLPAALAAAPVQAQPSTAEVLAEEQREALREAMRLECRPSGDDAEIVVCGSRQEERRYRLEPLPGAVGIGPASQAGGEQRAAMNNDSCTRLCPSEVGIALNPIELILNPKRALRRILEPLE